MAFMTGSSIKLRDPLKDPLSAIGGASQGRLQDILGAINARTGASQMASGRPMGSYMGQTLGKAQTLASRGIDDSLYGLIGDASYGEDKADRNHLRMVALAKKFGQMQKPSTMQEILGGVGQLGKLIPAGQSLYGAYQGMGATNPAYGSGSNPYGFDWDTFRGYDLMDNELLRR